MRSPLWLLASASQESAVLAAIEAGIRQFGENRVEEASIKIPSINQQVETALTWHMVGHIQSRKAKLVPPLFDTVHSIDTVKIAQRLADASEETALNCLLEINISGEASKHGFAAHNWQNDSEIREALFANVREIVAISNISITGLMTMAPHTDDNDLIRGVFRDLANLRDALQNEIEITLPDLSMGMSNDYPIAIEEGATLIRPGTAIFGARQY